MYTAVLMAALTTTTTSPNFHRYGCSGFSTYGCTCGSPYPYSYNPGCYGCAYYGSYGYLGVYDPRYVAYSGCYGCYGGHSCYGIALPATTVPPVVPPTRDPYPAINPPKKDMIPEKDDAEEVGAPKEKKKPIEDKKAPEPEKKAKIEKLSVNAPLRAKVRIEVPEGGELFVDDRAIGGPTGMRVFQTPPLAPGERYFYDVRIERAGEVRSQRVIIEPGQEVAVSFPGMAATARVKR